MLSFVFFSYFISFHLPFYFVFSPLIKSRLLFNAKRQAQNTILDYKRYFSFFLHFIPPVFLLCFDIRFYWSIIIIWSIENIVFSLKLLFQIPRYDQSLEVLCCILYFTYLFYYGCSSIVWNIYICSSAIHAFFSHCTHPPIYLYLLINLSFFVPYFFFTFSLHLIFDYHWRQFDVQPVIIRIEQMLNRLP